MRNLEDIDNDLFAAREALLSVEGTLAEVYSRIVGYYRSVRNWNRGKREEYGERRLYRVDVNSVNANSADTAGLRAAAISPPPPMEEEISDIQLLLFVRTACPNCSPAKAAAGQLGIPVILLNADTTDGMAEARRRKVMSTPTAILLSPGGEELKRARDAETISKLLVAEPVAV